MRNLVCALLFFPAYGNKNAGSILIMEIKPSDKIVYQEEKIMPKTRKQSIIFGIIMSVTMTYGMEVYNAAIKLRQIMGLRKRMLKKAVA